MSIQESQGSPLNSEERAFFQEQDLTVAMRQAELQDFETDDGRTVGAQTVELEDYEGITTTPSARPTSSRSRRLLIGDLPPPETNFSLQTIPSDEYRDIPATSAT